MKTSEEIIEEVLKDRVYYPDDYRYIVRAIEKALDLQRKEVEEMIDELIEITENGWTGSNITKGELRDNITKRMEKFKQKLRENFSLKKKTSEKKNV